MPQAKPGLPLAKRLLIVGLALAGIALRIYMSSLNGPAAICGMDFPVFYASGSLAGTPQLYSAPAVQAIQQREIGCRTDSAIFIRLPYFAGLMRPWALLPFGTAFALWRVLSIAALVAFIWLFRARWEWALLALAWSVPAATNIFNGQDVAFLLLCVTLAMTLVDRRAPFCAGLALSLCAAKFHLFFLLPLQLLASRSRRLGWGMAAGFSALIAASYALQGWTWPWQFWAAATDRRSDPGPGRLWNLRALAGGNLTIEIVLALAIAACAVYIFRRGDFRYGVAAMLVGGLLLSHHGGRSDPLLLLPAAFTLAYHPWSDFSKKLAFFLLTPFAYLIPARRDCEVPVLAMIALMVVLVWEVRRAHKPAIAPATS